MNRLGELISKSGGLTHFVNMTSSWVLRELETGKSVIIVGCDETNSFLYSPPSFKLQRTQGYTYCVKAVLGPYVAGWIIPKRAEPLYDSIYKEMAKRYGTSGGTGLRMPSRSISAVTLNCSLSSRVSWLRESPFPLLLHYERESPAMAERHLVSREVAQPPLSPLTSSELSGTFILFGILISVTTGVFFLESVTRFVRRSCNR